MLLELLPYPIDTDISPANNLESTRRAEVCGPHDLASAGSPPLLR